MFPAMRYQIWGLTECFATYNTFVRFFSWKIEVCSSGDAIDGVESWSQLSGTDDEATTVADSINTRRPKEKQSQVRLPQAKYFAKQTPSHNETSMLQLQSGLSTTYWVCQPPLPFFTKAILLTRLLLDDDHRIS